jgi:hypothetical protein
MTSHHNQPYEASLGNDVSQRRRAKRLTLDQKRALIVLFGDIPTKARQRALKDDGVRRELGNVVIVDETGAPLLTMQPPPQ